MSSVPSPGPPNTAPPEGLAGWAQHHTDAHYAHGKVRCVIVTPEKAFFDGVGDFLVVPMFDGELGVLPDHAPLIGRLGAGELLLRDGATNTRFFVEPGFVQIRNNTVTVLTARAMKAADVTAAVAERATAEAEALPADTTPQRDAKARARERAQGMRKVAEHNSGTPAAAH